MNLNHTMKNNPLKPERSFRSNPVSSPITPCSIGTAAFGLALIATALAFTGCKPANLVSTVDTGGAAEAVYVRPGQHDEFYNIVSGGFSGNVSVYGLPSGRLFRQIPVFSQFPECGWGYSEETRLGNVRSLAGGETARFKIRLGYLSATAAATEESLIRSSR